MIPSIVICVHTNKAPVFEAAKMEVGKKFEIISSRSPTLVLVRAKSLEEVNATLEGVREKNPKCLLRVREQTRSFLP
jgi:hypothetical protein